MLRGRWPRREVADVVRPLLGAYALGGDDLDAIAAERRCRCRRCPQAALLVVMKSSRRCPGGSDPRSGSRRTGWRRQWRWLCRNQAVPGRTPAGTEAGGRRWSAAARRRGQGPASSGRGGREGRAPSRNGQSLTTLDSGAVSDRAGAVGRGATLAAAHARDAVTRFSHAHRDTQQQCHQDGGEVLQTLAYLHDNGPRRRHVARWFVLGTPRRVAARASGCISSRTATPPCATCSAARARVSRR